MGQKVASGLVPPFMKITLQIQQNVIFIYIPLKDEKVFETTNDKNYAD